MGEINLAGFVMTADEWESLEPGTRIALAATLDRPTATPTVSTLALALRTGARIADPAPARRRLARGSSDDLGRAPTEDFGRAATEELALFADDLVRDDYDAYELLASAA